MTAGVSLPLAAGLLAFGLLAGGCTPGSSGSPKASDTMSASDRTSSMTEGQQRDPAPPEPIDADNPRSVAEKLSDATIEARIKQALVERKSLRAFDFSPQVVRGRVVLRGDVDTREQYERADRVARAVTGVETLANQITVNGQVASDGGGGAATASATAYHTVEPGDSLWEIAREYDISIERIRALNSETSSLEPGQRIRIR